MTDQPPPNGNGVNGLSGADMLALLSHITGLLDAMEGRIIDRLNENAAGAAARWTLHDAELARNTQRVIDRFVIIETDLATVSKCLEEHLKKEEKEDLAAEVRVAPLRAIGHFFVHNWKDILIFILGALVLIGVLGVEWRAIGGK
jgi:hypothetical protein